MKTFPSTTRRLSSLQILQAQIALEDQVSTDVDEIRGVPTDVRNAAFWIVIERSRTPELRVLQRRDARVAGDVSRREGR